MNLFKNSTIYLFSNILNALVPFFLLPILTHKLSPGDYGQIAMFQTLVSGLAALTGLNTIGAANRRYYDNLTENELSNYNGACIYILLFSTAFVFILSLLFQLPLSKLLNIPQSWIYIAVTVSAGTFIIQFRLGQWQIREQVWRFGLLQITQSIILFVLTVILLLVAKQGVVSRINAFFWGTLIYTFISLLTLFRDNALTLYQIKKAHIIDALKFGVPLVPHIIGIFFLSAIDRIIINHELGVEDAGIYMLGVQLSLGMVVVFDAINKALIPWLFKILSANDLVKINRLVRFTYFYFILLIFLGCLSFWIGPLVVKFLASTEYQRATGVIGWLCLGQAFNGMYLMVTNYLFYAKRTGRLSIVTITSGILNIILLLIMMKTNGIIGVAMAYSISMCVRFFATWILVQKLNLVSWSVFSRT